MGTLNQTVYVDKSGNDGTGDGSAGNPFLTIGAALAIINDADFTTKPYTIELGAGVYSENVALIDGVTIHGRGRFATRIDGNVTFDPGVLFNLASLNDLWVTGDCEASGNAILWLDKCNLDTVSDAGGGGPTIFLLQCYGTAIVTLSNATLTVVASPMNSLILSGTAFVYTDLESLPTPRSVIKKDKARIFLAENQGNWPFLRRLIC